MQRGPNFPVIVGILLCIAGVGFAAKQSAKPAAPHAVGAVRFDACGDTAGILVIRSDGSTTWHRPPFQGLREQLVNVPDGGLHAIQHCPVDTSSQTL